MLVDKEDQWILDRQNWYIGTSGYVQRPLNFSDGKRRTVLFHRLICGLRKGDKRQVDHINGNKLDNRRVNLRICTRRQNHYNQQHRRANKTGYRGVYKTNDNIAAPTTVNAGISTPSITKYARNSPTRTHVSACVFSRSSMLSFCLRNSART